MVTGLSTHCSGQCVPLGKFKSVGKLQTGLLPTGTLTEVSGDGLIVSTPSGSTGHNLSAGGPIMHSGIKAIVLTPLAAHSLTHRPLVVECNHLIEVTARRTNEGTTVIVDGQVAFQIDQGDVMAIRRYAADFQIVHNPSHPKWHNLVTKLRWGLAPEP